jgi:hypothetical protein
MGKKGKTFPVLHAVNGSRDLKWWPPSFSLQRAGGTHVVKDDGSVWLRWLLKQRGIILAHPNHMDNRCA